MEDACVMKIKEEMKRSFINLINHNPDKYDFQFHLKNLVNIRNKSYTVLSEERIKDLYVERKIYYIRKCFEDINRLIEENISNPLKTNDKISLNFIDDIKYQIKEILKEEDSYLDWIKM